MQQYNNADDEETMIQAVLFDWGGTVMSNLPFAGPMVDWPRVEAIPGVSEALEVMAPRYRLALATNAGDSGPTQVQAALRRVGLAEHFQAIFTASQLCARKPQPAFFAAALRELGCAPNDTVMVGDDYVTDIQGPKSVGLRAVWYNPFGLPCPTVHPLQDGEVRSMADLPALLEHLTLPDVDECLGLLRSQDAPPAVLRHVQAVAALAYRLALRLHRLGEPVDPLLAHRGALLHDLDKITSRRQNRTHGELGAEVLRSRSQLALAAIVERHLMFTILSPASRPTNWEEKLVYYADKVVEGNAIVGVQERLNALCGRYPQDAARIRACLPLVLELEQEICSRLGVAPADLIATPRYARG